MGGERNRKVCVLEELTVDWSVSVRVAGLSWGNKLTAELVVNTAGGRRSSSLQGKSEMATNGGPISVRDLRGRRPRGSQGGSPPLPRCWPELLTRLRGAEESALFSEQHMAATWMGTDNECMNQQTRKAPGRRQRGTDNEEPSGI